MTKEEIFEELDEKVNKYLPIYENCAQTSFRVLKEQFNIKSDKIIAALAPFPGIALRGETCGAVTGSLMAIALIYEPDKNKGNQNKPPSFKFEYSIKPAGVFCDGFEKEFSTTRCAGVIEHVSGRKYNLLNPEEVKQWIDDGGAKKCLEVVKKAVNLAADIILDKS